MKFEDILDYIEGEAQAPFVTSVAAKVADARALFGGTVGKASLFTSTSDDLGESGTGDFLPYEDAIAALLQAAWSRKAQSTFDDMVDAMDGTFNGNVVTKADWTQYGMDNAVNLGTAKMADLLNAADWERLKVLTKQAAKRGAALIKSVEALETVPRFDNLLEGMANSSRYFTNNYFNTQVVPSLYKAVERVMDDGDLTSPTRIFKEVRAALDKRLLGRTPYWHTVGSGAASRAYHYGLIKAGRAKGYRGYRLNAVRDARTSEICIKLDGKEFWLADAERVYDKIAQAQGEDIKDVHPWLTKSDVEGLTSDQVYDRAALVPPFHGRCRTTMELLSV